MSELACLPLGIGNGDQGVCLLIKIGPYRVLLDCGISNLSPLLTMTDDRYPVDFVFCSHAHSDHARGLLALRQAYPHLPIYGSEVTSQLLPLNWLGQTVPDNLCQALPWHTPVDLLDGLTVQIWPAGHLPGAACILLRYAAPERPYTLFYTGDFFLSNSRLVDGLPLDQLRGLKPDVLILEGSYGTARHPHRRQQENRLAATIQGLLQQGSSVLMPSPTLGTGQELVMLLRSHHHFTGKDMIVWVDPTVAAGCDQYLEMMSYFPSTVQNFARHQALFWDERILPRVRRLENPQQIDHRHPTIVIGHYTNGLNAYCQQSSLPWTILLPESFAADMATAMLHQPQAETDLTLTWLQALAPQLESGQVQLATYLLTSHCDLAGTTQLIHNLRPQHVMFVHGPPAYLNDLAGLEELQSRYQLHLPSVGKLVDMPIGATFIQPDAPDPVYEGEVTQTSDAIITILPETLAADSRWQQLADTGIIQARWQGNDLVLKGVPQQEILRRVTGHSGPGTAKTCQHCRFLQNQFCRNPISPLGGFRVNPDGYCPVFEPSQPLPTSDHEDWDQTSEASA